MNKISNMLIMIENGQLSTYPLDDKLSWEVGRPSKDNSPDIKLYSATASRKHGRFENKDGVWFYIDYNGKNGTVYKGKKISQGLNGRLNPILLNDGDIFVFGGGEEAVIDAKTIWAMFTTKQYAGEWRTLDTKGYSDLIVTDETDNETKCHLQKGEVVERKNGMAIYMGDITYLIGDIHVSGD